MKDFLKFDSFIWNLQFSHFLKSCAEFKPKEGCYCNKVWKKTADFIFYLIIFITSQFMYGLVDEITTADLKSLQNLVIFFKVARIPRE